MKYSLLVIGVLVLYFYLNSEKPKFEEKDDVKKPQNINTNKKVKLLKGKINEINRENFKELQKEKKFFILFYDTKYVKYIF